MANINETRINGNPTRAPEKRQFPNSEDWQVSFGLAHTPRYQDRQTQEWKDGKTVFFEVEVRGGSANADNVLALVSTKTKLIVTGKLGTFERKDGSMGIVLKDASVTPDWTVRQGDVAAQGDRGQRGPSTTAPQSDYSDGWSPSYRPAPAARQQSAPQEAGGGFNWDTQAPGGY